MIFERILIVLAVFGLVDSAYLWYEHRQKNASLICPLDHDCSAVTESRWANMFGVRNEVLGAIYYFLMLLGGVGLAMKGETTFPLKTLLVAASLGGFIFSGFLTVVQFRVIKDYCFYCLISAGLSTLIFITALIIKF